MYRICFLTVGKKNCCKNLGGQIYAAFTFAFDFQDFSILELFVWDFFCQCKRAARYTISIFPPNFLITLIFTFFLPRQSVQLIGWWMSPAGGFIPSAVFCYGEIVAGSLQWVNFKTENCHCNVFPNEWCSPACWEIKRSKGSLRLP